MRDRVVLQTLVVRGGDVVEKENLAYALWGEELPPTWPKAVQGCIARLRKLLPPGAIETTPYGYRLVVHEDQLDARRFERMLGRAREHLVDGDPDRASYVLAEALALWRGRATARSGRVGAGPGGGRALGRFADGCPGAEGRG